MTAVPLSARISRFSANSLERGRRLFDTGAVLEWRLAADASKLDGRVIGTRRTPYHQSVTFGPRSLRSTCTCPLGGDCKHVAALLFAAQDALTAHGRFQASDTSTATTPLTAPATSSLTGDAQPAPGDQGPERHALEGQTSGPLAPSPAAQAPALGSALSGPLRVWLHRLDENLAGDVDAPYPEDVRTRLVYVIGVRRSPDDLRPIAVFQPMRAYLLKSGAFGSSQTFEPSSSLSAQPAKFLRASDRAIIAEMDLVKRRGAQAGFHRSMIGADPLWLRIITRALATGRCRLETVNGAPLREGPPRRATAHWQTLAGGRQRLAFTLAETDAADAMAAPRHTPVEDTARAARGPESAKTAAIDAILPTTPPLYVDAAAGLVGPLDLGLPDPLAQGLAELPDITPTEAHAFCTAFAKRLSALDLAHRVPLPAPPQSVVQRTITPRPRLEVFMGRLAVRAPYAAYLRPPKDRVGVDVPMARLSFLYGDISIASGSYSEQLEWLEDGALIVAPRNPAAEASARARLLETGFVPIAASILTPTPDSAGAFVLAPCATNLTNPRNIVDALHDTQRFLAFSTDAVPALRQEGWLITMAQDYPYRIAEGEVAWWADIGDGSAIDWFSFEIGVTFEGVRIDLAGQLAAMLRRLPSGASDLALSDDESDKDEFLRRCGALTLYQPLPDGRLLALPGARVAPVLRALFELIGPRADDPTDRKVGLHRAQAHQLAGLVDSLGDDVAWAAGAQRLAALGRQLQAGALPTDAPPPQTFKATLRPYQAAGLAWLEFLRASGFGGVLADDMGLGKTVQTLAFLAREKAAGRLVNPALIVAPTSILPNWQAEASRFAPDLKLLTLHGLDRKQAFGAIANHDVVLTTYPLLARDQRHLLKHIFHAAILDEAQAIKNPRAAVSGIAHKINARHRLALTGTPLENHLGEVWSLFEFLSPGLLGDEAAFRRTFRTPIEKHGDKAAQAFLTRRLKPFMLRRTKEEVAGDLPPKTEILERIRLEGDQRDLYETVRALMHDKVRQEIARKGVAKSHIVFLDALLKLRQICCDPRLLKLQAARKVKQSAKLERLMEMLPDMIAEGRRILLFSQFTSMLALIEAEARVRAIPYALLTGDTTDRAAPVAAFQAGEVPLFLLSLKAGGVGLNLTAADTVIHYDPWWNPAIERQASDRAHRIGQTKPVFVYKLIVEEGIEEAIELLKVRKAALAEALFEGASKTGLDLSEDDIAALFAPLSGGASGRT